jgi:predicted nuclease with TOPRIM domain
LNQRIEELQKEKGKLEEEKKLADDEITQLNQEIYNLNDKILQMQVNGAVSPIKAPGAEDSSKDLSYSLTQDKAEYEALQRFFELKDSNVRR